MVHSSRWCRALTVVLALAVAPFAGEAQPAGRSRGPAGVDSAFSAILREPAGALVVLPDPMFRNHHRRIIDLAAHNRLPTVYWSRDLVDAGGLMAYGTNIPEIHRRAATFVDKILKGARPGDLPVEQPTKFELVINLKTAKTLGLAIPQLLLWLDGVDGEPVDGAGAGVPGVLGVSVLGGMLGDTEVPLPDVPPPDVEPGALVPSLLVWADASTGARPIAMTRPARMSFFMS
jgi:hypothetical protein